MANLEMRVREVLREQMQLLGVEIEKLGKRLQAAAAKPKEPVQ
jgi:hypothetical protein